MCSKMRYISVDSQFACSAGAVPVDLEHEKQEKHLKKKITDGSTEGLNPVGINLFKYKSCSSYCPWPGDG